MLKGNSKKALLEDFILINEALVGDDLKKHDFKQMYSRHGVPHCCGQAVATLPNGNPYCEVCGSEYK